jgi:hypothetical protein
MKVVALAAACFFGALLCACPGRKELVEEIGGAPAAQVEQARSSLHQSEQRLEEKAAAAAAVFNE